MEIGHSSRQCVNPKYISNTFPSYVLAVTGCPLSEVREKFKSGKWSVTPFTCPCSVESHALMASTITRPAATRRRLKFRSPQKFLFIEKHRKFLRAILESQSASFNVGQFQYSIQFLYCTRSGNPLYLGHAHRKLRSVHSILPSAPPAASCKTAAAPRALITDLPQAFTSFYRWNPFLDSLSEFEYSF